MRTVGAVLAVGVLLLAGCSSDAGTPGLASDDAGFVAGDGSIVVLSPEDRAGPVSLVGETVDGVTMDSADLLGTVVVVNVWGSWCAPCRAEAPDLVTAHDDLMAAHPDQVTFAGINIRDASTVNAQRFEEEFAIPYDSWSDPDGVLLLQLRGEIPPSAIPSTLVLDADGAVAARALGAIDASTLVGMVEQVLGTAGAAEQSGESSAVPTS